MGVQLTTVWHAKEITRHDGIHCRIGTPVAGFEPSSLLSSLRRGDVAARQAASASSHQSGAAAGKGGEIEHPVDGEEPSGCEAG
jgi:hypothetical protein